MRQMNISHEMPPRNYPSEGRCIYCCRAFPPEQLREEHIIPLALGGAGVINGGACIPCQNDTNRLYENAALQSDMIRVPRALLVLKRRRAKEKKPIWFPPIFPHGTASLKEVGHLQQRWVGRDEYPPVFAMLVIEPPGKLSPTYFPGRRPERKKIRVWICVIEQDNPASPVVSDEAEIQGGFDFNRSTLISMDYTHNDQAGSLRQRINVNAFALMLAKIGYSFGVAELGTDGFDGIEIRQLLRDERKDIYNFVGCPSDGGLLTPRYLHYLGFRERGELLSVIVHLFSSYQAPLYEVVIGRKGATNIKVPNETKNVSMFGTKRAPTVCG